MKIKENVKMAWDFYRGYYAMYKNGSRFEKAKKALRDTARAAYALKVRPGINKFETWLKGE